jgi:hypothetical protein
MVATRSSTAAVPSTMRGATRHFESFEGSGASDDDSNMITEVEAQRIDYFVEDVANFIAGQDDFCRDQESL